MQARLRFSILTSLRPDVLLLDEGLATADAEFTARANRRLNDFMSAAGILVLASHGDDLVRTQCSEAIWLRSGLVAAQGPVEGVLAAYHTDHAIVIS
jgi:ABC-type polysaccharide/polyol phosphate transport system ATPase subunit